MSTISYILTYNYVGPYSAGRVAIILLIANTILLI
nr:MAG TPA: hypothetical protein [Bacteriophage sp.]